MKANVKAMKSRKSRATNNVEPSSGNAFADLEFKDAEERLLKAKLATKIAQVVERRGWSQAQIGDRTALDQPKVSRLLRGQLSGFSADRLMTILNGLESRG
jgi:predicted XRE-type DNA-binding protein